MRSDIFQLLMASVVKIGNRKRPGHGTGFFINKNTIITCCHVVDQVTLSDIEIVTHENQIFTIEKIEYCNAQYNIDFSILKIKGEIKYDGFLHLFGGESVPGDDIYSFGYPDQDFNNGCPVTLIMEGNTGDTPALMKFKSGQVRPGMSGSPLLNLRTNKVCGILKFSRDRSSDLGGGGIPISTVISNYSQIIVNDVESKDILDDLEPVGECRISLKSAPDKSLFYGRKNDLYKLGNLVACSNIVGVFGLKGVGKTSLVRNFIDHMIDNNNFDFYIWRSLLNAPSLFDMLIDIIKVFPDSDEEKYSTTRELVEYFILKIKKYKCFIVIDNFESILDENSSYMDGFSEYRDFFERVSLNGNNSCIVFTSRENPTEFDQLDAENDRVNAIIIRGLDIESGGKIFNSKGIYIVNENDLNNLIGFYDGNPLALILIAFHIRKVFSGNVESFLQAGDYIFGTVGKLIDWHFVRMHDEEKEILYWIALYRKSVNISEIKYGIFSQKTKCRVPSLIHGINNKFPLILSDEKFTFQPVIIEYLIDKFIESIIKEIMDLEFSLLKSHPLVIVSIEDYITNYQLQVILPKILEKLRYFYSDAGELKSFLLGLLDMFRGDFDSGYLCGNIINIILSLNDILDCADFSNLYICQVSFKNKILLDVDFSDSIFADVVFTESFSNVLSLDVCNDSFSVGTDRGEIVTWNYDYKVSQFIAHSEWVNSLDYDESGGFLLSGSGDKCAKLWDVFSRKCLCQYIGHSHRIVSVKLSACSKFVATGSSDSTVKLWNAKTGELLRTFSGHSKLIRSIDFSSDGSRLISGSGDQTVKLWDTQSGICIKTFIGHDDIVTSVLFSKSNKHIYSASLDSTIKVWSIDESTSSNLLKTFKGHTAPVWSLALLEYNEGINFLASGSQDCTIRLWDINSGSCLTVLRGHTSWIWSLKFRPKSQMLLSAGNDKVVKIWDINNGECIKSINGYVNPVWSVQFSHDGRFIACGNDDSTLKILDARDGKVIKILDGHKNRVRSVCFHPKRAIIATGGEDNTIRIWDINSGRCIKEIVDHNHWLRSVSFSLCGEFLVGAGNDSVVRYWNINNLNAAFYLEHNDTINIAVFLDKNTIITAGNDLLINIWDVNSQQCVRKLSGHSCHIRLLKISPDCSMLVSASDDGVLCVWDITSYECITVLAGHSDYVIWGVDFSFDNKYLITGGDDKVVKIWDLKNKNCIGKIETASWVRSICAHIRANLSS